MLFVSCTLGKTMWLPSFVDKWQEKKKVLFMKQKKLSSNEIIQSHIFDLVLGQRSELGDLFPVVLFPVTV